MPHFQLITDNVRWGGESNYFVASRNEVRTSPIIYKWQQYFLIFLVNKMFIVPSGWLERNGHSGLDFFGASHHNFARVQLTSMLIQIMEKFLGP